MLILFHNGHVVSNSIYPFFMGVSLTGFFLSLVVFMKSGLFFFLLVNLFSLLFLFFVWGKDVYYESSSGYHNVFVDRGFKLGFVIFVFTEFMFFVGIFWVFFDKICLSNYLWWPVGSGYLDFLGLPLLGTLVLLSSGLFSTWGHNDLLSGGTGFFEFCLTLFLGVFFLFIQVFEYTHLFFNMSDGWGGSIFFFLTGFHGFHVCLGVILLFLSLLRIFFYYYSSLNNYFFEGSVIYWHFVDVVWLFLYLSLYM